MIEFTHYTLSNMDISYFRKKVSDLKLTLIFNRKTVHVYTWLLGVLLFVFLLFSPMIHYKIGNIFFGGVSTLYNVTLAQFFFLQATDPMFGKVPPFAYHQLSRTYFIQGELKNALILAKRELELYPDHWNTYYIIGLTLGYMNREEEAIDAFGKFIEHKPLSWAARNDRAWLQFRIGDIDGALATMEPVSRDIRNPWIQNTYGTLLLNKERYMEARQAFMFAQQSADLLTEETWGNSYPGNDPRVYGTGLQAMRNSIANNLKIIEEKQL